MPKNEYKFVTYEKLDPDAHTDLMLSNLHGDIPEFITDKQLDEYHFDNKELTTEKLLEDKRTGSRHDLLEKMFNEDKGLYGSQYRDSSTYDGDISKLEQKRVEKYNIENEKYEAASETPKRDRWWNIKSEDGLKIAYKNLNYLTKQSQAEDQDLLNFDDLDFGDPDGTDFDVYETDDELLDDVDDDGEIDDFNIDEIDNAKGGFTIYSQEIDDSTGTKILYFDIDIENPDKYSGSDDPRLEEDLKRFFNENFPEFKFSMDMIEIDLEVANRAQGMTTESIDIEAFSVSDLTINFPVFKKKSN